MNKVKWSSLVVSLVATLIVGRIVNAQSEKLVSPSYKPAIPAVWQEKEFLGRGFRVVIPYRPDYYKKAGIENEPFIKDAVLSVNWEIMKYPDSAAYKKVLSLNNSIMVRVSFSRTDGLRALPEKIYNRWKRDFRDRFIGLFLLTEFFGSYRRELGIYGGRGLPLSNQLARELPPKPAVIKQIKEWQGNPPPKTTK